MIYLRKGGEVGSPIPFGDDEFQKAQDFLEHYPQFRKMGDGLYTAKGCDIQFSDGVNCQVQISNKTHPAVRGLIQILQPEFYLTVGDIGLERHPISDLENT
jgi:hypothetical protein